MLGPALLCKALIQRANKMFNEYDEHLKWKRRKITHVIQSIILFPVKNNKKLPISGK